MRYSMLIGLGTAVCLALVSGGCPQNANQTNPFLTAGENYGSASTGIAGGDQGQGSSGAAAETRFRSTITVTLENYDTRNELNTAWMAWVNANNIRSADQQDELLSAGYVQLSREVAVGAAYRLPPGTFVYNGPGKGGATLVRIGPATPGASDNDPIVPAELEFEILAPDVLLIFSQPPVSCETPAFFYTRDGVPFDVTPNPDFPGEAFAGAENDGPVKSLAQFDVYQCDPFRPGLFLRTSGGGRQANEFLEGQHITVQFFRQADAVGDSAFVTILDE